MKSSLSLVIAYWLSAIKVCTLILSFQLVVNEAYEHDIKDMQARLRKEIKWISLIMEFKFNACWSSKLKIVSDGKP